MDWKKSEAFLLNFKKVTADYVDPGSLKCSKFQDLDTFYFELTLKLDFSEYSTYFNP